MRKEQLKSIIDKRIQSVKEAIANPENEIIADWLEGKLTAYRNILEDLSTFKEDEL